jgi:hypothetical protein
MPEGRMVLSFYREARLRRHWRITATPAEVPAGMAAVAGHVLRRCVIYGVHHRAN